MVRTFGIAALLFATPLAALAQQAICDCCMVPYTVPRASWIGTSRGYGGICPDCSVKCMDCRDRADDLRTQYRTFNGMRLRKGLAAAQISHLDRLINRSHQRWSDLRYSCLAASGRDIGTIGPQAPVPPPSRGITTPETKQRLRDQAQRAVSDYEDIFFGADSTFAMEVPGVRKVIFDAIRERSRASALLNRLADDPPDPDVENVVIPALDQEPKDDGDPKDVLALARANVALKNSNACIDSYITSFERYQAAQKAGNKDAAQKQVDEMGRFAHQAESAARTSAAHFREFERLFLKRIDDRRAVLAKVGVKWQDGLKAFQDNVRERWPADVAKAFEGAKIPAKQSDSLRKIVLELTPEAVEKKLSERRAAIESEDEAAETARAAKKSKPIVPELPHQEALLLMVQEAHLIHADLAGKRRELPKDKPFPEDRKEGKK
jgi:hypothetical protein